MNCEPERTWSPYWGGPFRAQTHRWLVGDDLLLNKGTPCLCGQTQAEADRKVSNKLAEAVTFIRYQETD